MVGFKGTYGLVDPKGILEGEDDPGEMIRWFSHPGIMTRTVEDAALVLDVLTERHQDMTADYFDGLAKDRKVRIGVADNFGSDPEVLAAFERAVEKIRGLGHLMKSVAVPRNPDRGLGNIEADRKAIAGQSFKDIDVLLLPTTATTVPEIKGASANPQALSPENTVFANYYGLPAISVPCGFDRNGLPLGLQIVGKPWDEARVLHLAYRYEKLKVELEFGMKIVISRSGSAAKSGGYDPNHHIAFDLKSQPVSQFRIQCTGGFCNAKSLVDYWKWKRVGSVHRRGGLGRR